MALSLTAVKQAIVDLLGDTLPSDVSVLNAMPADVRGRAVIVGDCSTTYNTARLRADPTLLRYDLQYSVQLQCCSGPNLRDPQTADASAYGLMDLVLTPLVRGDSTGRTRLAVALPSVIDVVPVGDNMLQSWDATDGHDVIVGLTIEVRTRRE